MTGKSFSKTGPVTTKTDFSSFVHFLTNSSNFFQIPLLKLGTWGLYHDNDFWIPITNLTEKEVIGFLKFKKVGQAMFVVDGIRSALCPMLISQDLCKESLKCQREHC